MIFITEQDLRDLYGKQAFETFTLIEGERLTPGARQFLADRQISIVDPADVKPYKTATIQIDGSEEYTDGEEGDGEPEGEPAPEPAAPEQPAAEAWGGEPAAPVVKNILEHGNEKLKGRFCALQALYLKQAVEIYGQNQTLANEIFDMECSLRSIEAGSDLNILVPGVCNGMFHFSNNAVQQPLFHDLQEGLPVSLENTLCAEPLVPLHPYRCRRPVPEY